MFVSGCVVSVYLCLLCNVLVCFVMVFFFKQKTAYEMRISDWSSDVCSSDLAAKGNQTPTTASDPGLDTPSFKKRWEDFKAVIAYWKAHPALQIGRASCRERVCQYV